MSICRGLSGTLSPGPLKTPVAATTLLTIAERLCCRTNNRKGNTSRDRTISACTSGRGLELSRQPPHRGIQHRCRAKKTAEAPATGENLAPAQEGYYSIALEGCEYLFGVTIDGRLNLRDAYVMDFATGIYAQPTIDEGVPEEPAMYHEVPWEQRYEGDRMMLKDPWEKVHRVYLIQMKAKAPPDLDLEKVFVLDHETRDVRVADVQKPEEPFDMNRMVLRLRSDGVYLECYDIVPDAEELNLDHEISMSMEPRKDVEEEEGPLDPIDARDDFDGPSDIPAVDLE